jgi:hypothetical protein
MGYGIRFRNKRKIGVQPWASNLRYRTMPSVRHRTDEAIDPRKTSPLLILALDIGVGSARLLLFFSVERFFFAAMVGLRKLDAFVKTRPELRSQSAVGGMITLVAATVSAFLFVGQIIHYIIGNPKDSLLLSKSVSIPLIPLTSNYLTTKILERAAKLPLDMLITFPYLHCSQLDFNHDGASLATSEFQKLHPKHSLTMRTPFQHELSTAKFETKKGQGCTIEGHIRVPVVAGKFEITLNKRTWQQAASILNRQMLMQVLGATSEHTSSNDELGDRYNSTHFIHYIRFGDSFPLNIEKPLEKRRHIFRNKYGAMAVQEMKIELVPTYTSTWLPTSSRQTYQASVVDSTIEPEHMAQAGASSLPGLAVQYDFSPLTVYHTGGRDNILVFLSSLVSIVGGVFVTVGLVSGCLVHSAQAVAKKID